jgi:hypothetical protein
MPVRSFAVGSRLNMVGRPGSSAIR